MDIKKDGWRIEMELVFNLGIGVFLLFLFSVTGKFRADSVEGDVLKAAGFPRLLLVLALCLVVISIIKRIREWKRTETKSLDFKSIESKMMIGLIAFFSLYIFMINITGYVVSTFLFSVFAARVMGYTKIGTLALFGLVVTVVFVLLFGKVFYIPLPRGAGILREISYYLY